MKSSFFIIILSIILLSGASVKAQDKLSPYFKVASLVGSMQDASDKVEQALQKWDFEVLGSYNPAKSDQLQIIAFTRKDLQDVCLKVEDRGILASVLKVGIQQNGDQLTVSVLNPMYLFYAYLRDDASNHLDDLTLISGDVKQAMSEVGKEYTGFGGSEKIDNLTSYHYMAFMPYFDDPVELKTFESFEQGLNTIHKNLNAGKNNTVKVFELVLGDKQMAVIGIGLLDKEDGEAKFLPIIGEENIAAMPYEIVLMGKEASILHGKFRFALHWPELSMGQFMKISSTPGDVEDFMEALTSE